MSFNPDSTKPAHEVVLSRKKIMFHSTDTILKPTLLITYSTLKVFHFASTSFRNNGF